MPDRLVLDHLEYDRDLTVGALNGVIDVINALARLVETMRDQLALIEDYLGIDEPPDVEDVVVKGDRL